MSELMGCQVPGCRGKVVTRPGNFCRRHSRPVFSAQSFDQMRKRIMKKKKAEKDKAARDMARPENLLGCLLATTTSDGPLTGVVSSTATRNRRLLVASFEDGREMMLAGSNVLRGKALYEKLTRGAQSDGAVDPLPDEEKAMEGLSKYLIGFPAVAEITKPAVTAASERGYYETAVYAEKKAGSRFFFRLDNCAAARDGRKTKEDEAAPRAPPAGDMTAADTAFPLAPTHHPGQGQAVPGPCNEATSSEETEPRCSNA